MASNNLDLEMQQQQIRSPELTVPFLCVCRVPQTFINTWHALGQHMNNLVHSKIRKSILKTTNQSPALAAEKGNTPTELKAIMQIYRIPEFLSFCPPSHWSSSSSWGVPRASSLHAGPKKCFFHLKTWRIQPEQAGFFFLHPPCKENSYEIS